MNKNSILLCIGLIFVIVISFIIICQAKSIQIKPLSEEDFSIRGVKPYEKISNEIFKKLGTPKEIKETNTEEGRSKFYIYPSFTMITQFEDGNIEQIVEFEITGISQKTRRGITIGNSIKELFERYGSTKIEENICFYEFKPSASNVRGHILEFEIKKNNITKIWIK